MWNLFNLITWKKVRFNIYNNNISFYSEHSERFWFTTSVLKFILKVNLNSDGLLKLML